MSDQSAAAGQGPVIAKAGKRKWGYDVAQVDAFLARAHALYESDRPELTQHDIQTVSFDLVKNGYAIAQVDAALARLERAVVDKHTSWELAHGGRVPFKVHSEEMLSSLKAHYLREPKQRFKPGEGKHPSYDRKQVDRVVDQVIAKASSALGEQGSLPADAKELLDVTASRIANVIFTQRKGKRGYDERSVDYYLDVAVQLLSRLESFARVSEYAAETAAPSTAPAVQEAAAPAPVPPVPAPAPVAVPQSDRAAAGAQPTQVIPPLFTPSGQPNAEAQRAADSFSALNAAEHSIFAPKPAAPVPATAAPAPVPPVPAPTVPVPSAAPSVPSVSAATTAPAPVPAPATAPTAPVESAPAPIVSDSLAALAQSVPQHVETESAPTEAIAPVHDALFGEPSAPAVTAHVPSVAAPASHVAQTAAAPAPVAPVSVPPATVTPVQPVQPVAVPSAPFAAQATQPVQSVQPMPSAPVVQPAPVAQPAPIPPAPVAAAPAPVIAPKLDDMDAAKDAKPQDEGDRYLANLLNDTSFPKIDLDIPDLSFPSLSDDGSDVIDTPKKDGDQQSR